jgi:hypothetical protein
MSPTTPWPGRAASGSVVLPLPWSFVPPLVATLDLPEAPLQRKAELHLTLLAKSEADAVAGRADESEWAAYFARHDWPLRLTDRWFLLQRDRGGQRERSVVAEVECPALNAFRRELGYAAATALEPTLPHVTLWTAGRPDGIGLCSLAEFEARRVRALTAAEREAGIAAG